MIKVPTTKLLRFKERMENVTTEIRDAIDHMDNETDGYGLDGCYAYKANPSCADVMNRYAGDDADGFDYSTIEDDLFNKCWVKEWHYECDDSDDWMYTCHMRATFADSTEIECDCHEDNDDCYDLIDQKYEELFPETPETHETTD